jgi:hypothetical protein
MAWTLCTSGSAIMEAGTHANSTIIASGSLLADLSNRAEGYICAITNTDWVTNYSTLVTPLQRALSEVAAKLVGMSITKYDTTGYIAREADMIMNFNDEIVQRSLAVLNKKSNNLQTP